MDLSEGIALKGGVNLEKLQNLVNTESSAQADQLSSHSLVAHSRILPELSLGDFNPNAVPITSTYHPLSSNY